MAFPGKTLRLAILAISLLACSLTAQTLKVVTTQPDLADLARRIGGDAVEVYSLTEGGEDLHLVQVRPSTLARTRRADLFLQLGRDAEHAWVPLLLRTARNGKIQPGQPGFVNVSAGIPAIFTVRGRTRGDAVDLHPRGNPHWNLDPENFRQASHSIRDALSRLRPKKKAHFAKRTKLFEAELDRKMKAWRKVLAPHRGRGFVEEHDAWIYFAKRFGFEIVGRLEPKPGVQPTAGHLRRLQKKLAGTKTKLIVGAPFGRSAASQLATKIRGHAETLTLSSLKSDAKSGGIFAFFDRVVAAFDRGMKA
jgi:zinc/manganese transport system substrate-binding protein